MVLDTKAERIVSVPDTLQALRERLQAVLGLLNDDWPAPLWISGLLGLVVAWRGSRGEQGRKAPSDEASGHRAPTNVERIALLLTALGYFVLSLVIWEGFVSDALLAVKLPVIAMAAVGLAFIAARVAQRSPAAARLSMLVLAVLVAVLFAINRPQVLRITRDQGAEQTIALVQQVQPAADRRPISFMALWGNDFWQLAYAQAYEGRFEHLNLVDHNANFNELLARGDHLYTLERTFLTRSLADWEERLGEVQLSSVYPGIVEIRGAEQGESLSGTTSGEDLLAMANGIAIHEATLRWKDMGVIEVEVVWHALEKPELDYSVAVHLVSADPPAGPEHLLAQADRIHPVGGWYPTSQWHAGEFVTDHYLLPVPAEAQPVAVRVGMYRVLEDGTFENSEVLSLPLPEHPELQATQDE